MRLELKLIWSKSLKKEKAVGSIRKKNGGGKSLLGMRFEREETLKGGGGWVNFYGIKIGILKMIEMKMTSASEWW